MEVWIYFSSQKFCRIAAIGTISALLSIQKRPLDIVFPNHLLYNNWHQGEITSDVNRIQNTFFFFKKYQVALILFTNYSEQNIE